MKYTCKVNVAKAQEEAAKYYLNPDYFSQWQGGFVSFENLSGIPLTDSAVSKIIYKQRNNTIVLTEKIISIDFPNEIYAKYEHEKMINTMRTKFIAIEPEITEIIVEIDYTEFIGIMPKLMALLMPSMFKKQTQVWLDNFKLFVEAK